MVAERSRLGTRARKRDASCSGKEIVIRMYEVWSMRYALSSTVAGMGALQNHHLTLAYLGDGNLYELDWVTGAPTLLGPTGIEVVSGMNLRVLR